MPKTENWSPPEGYRVRSYCTTCGKDFSHDMLFDRHRTGKHQYTYTEGLKFDPPVEDGRRCRSSEELVEIGLRPMTAEEMQSSTRHSHRVGYGVEMWFDPAELARMRANMGAAGDS